MDLGVGLTLNLKAMIHEELLLLPAINHAISPHDWDHQPSMTNNMVYSCQLVFHDPTHDC